MNEKIEKLKEKIIEVLKTVYDPEVPVNIYDLGLIYNLEVEDNGTVKILMTLTAPNCPIADQILEEIKVKLELLEGIKDVKIELTFNPPWDPSRLSDEARLELGLL